MINGICIISVRRHNQPISYQSLSQSLCNESWCIKWLQCFCIFIVPKICIYGLVLIIRKLLLQVWRLCRIHYHTGIVTIIGFVKKGVRCVSVRQCRCYYTGLGWSSCDAINGSWWGCAAGSNGSYIEHKQATHSSQEKELNKQADNQHKHFAKANKHVTWHAKFFVFWMMPGSFKAWSETHKMTLALYNAANGVKQTAPRSSLHPKSNLQHHCERTNGPVAETWETKYSKWNPWVQFWICKDADETSPDSDLPLWCWDEYWLHAFHGSLYHNIPFFECYLRSHFPLATVQIQTWDENRSTRPSHKPQCISDIEIRKLSAWRWSRSGGKAWVRLWYLVPC